MFVEYYEHYLETELIDDLIGSTSGSIVLVVPTDNGNVDIDNTAF